MERLNDYLRLHSTGDLFPWRCQVEAAELFGLSLAQVEEAILAAGLLPARYQRNRKMLTTEQQRRLFQSRVAVVGCGGLGGYIIEELARLGVGTITAIDPDVFEEHNLNRQLLATPSLLGCAKAEAALRRVMEINPAVTLLPVREALNKGNGRELLGCVQVAVDALDNVVARLDLADVCAELEIPLVHGAIGGWYGQVLTQFPGDTTLRKILAGRGEGQGVEKHLGNPSFTPAVVASLEVAEVCKLLLGVGSPLRHRKVAVNLLEMEFTEVVF
jgi:molybdopterin-synthase adenylyltransferase